MPCHAAVRIAQDPGHHEGPKGVPYEVSLLQAPDLHTNNWCRVGVFRASSRANDPDVKKSTEADVRDWTLWSFRGGRSVGRVGLQELQAAGKHEQNTKLNGK